MRVRPGDSVRVAGAGFQPNRFIPLYFFDRLGRRSTLATPSTGAGGSFSFDVAVPSTAAIGSGRFALHYGANALGMISVWIDWAPRRPKVPADDLEVPAFTIRQPLELLEVIEALEQHWQQEQGVKTTR